MTFLLLLALGTAGAAVAAWGLGRRGREAQWGAIGGTIALVGVVVLAFMLDAPRAGSLGSQTDGGLLDGRLIPNDYLRLVVALWALDGALLVFVAWIGGGLAGLRGLLPAMLASIVGGSVAFAATDLVIGAAAAGATGFATLLVLMAPGDASTLGAAARELRVTLVATSLAIGSIVIAPVAAGLALRVAGAVDAGTDGEGPAALAAGGPEAVATIGLLVLAISVAVALRFGVIPFHVRVPRLADVAPAIALPLLLVWVPVPLAVVGLAAVDLLLAPLALPLQGEQWIVVAVAIVTLLAAALAAFLQDDLRHAGGYLVIADAGLLLLGVAALTPDAWGPARTWLVALAASKTALLAWAAVMETRFGTRSIPDLRGWMRRSPLLAAALLLTTAATFGLPGWAAFTARVDLGRLAGGPPLDGILVVLGFLTLPTYLRLLALGTGSPTTRVDRAAPERIARRRPGLAAPGFPGGRRPSATGTRRLGRRLMSALRRDATELTAAAVLTMAVLAALTSWGVLDISGAASEPAPIVTNAASD